MINLKKVCTFFLNIKYSNKFWITIYNKYKYNKMATARRNRSFYKAKVMKSTNAFSIFDQSQIQEFKEAFNLIGFL